MGVRGDVVFAIIVHDVVDDMTTSKVHPTRYNGIVFTIVDALDAIDAV